MPAKKRQHLIPVVADYYVRDGISQKIRAKRRTVFQPVGHVKHRNCQKKTAKKRQHLIPVVASYYSSLGICFERPVWPPFLTWPRRASNLQSPFGATGNIQLPPPVRFLRLTAGNPVRGRGGSGKINDANAVGFRTFCQRASDNPRTWTA